MSNDEYMRRNLRNSQVQTRKDIFLPILKVPGAHCSVLLSAPLLKIWMESTVPGGEFKEYKSEKVRGQRDGKLLTFRYSI